ncbi:DUF1697 domain-containing protein [Asticcacaulis sp. YBE204]|uniref:DUF1697 domain-containing protein n=1 Tax=Asticcacaulis sp. YBE204 TaxID=1282363 RepID=UPI0003C3B846|nr:DUF1697 domain-containing protein [Asticcacaulis sp. YBE204]ESQ77012.1 hypothetical protein AEYBE204_18155 [Asticcacaulis sp. YBE204]
MTVFIALLRGVNVGGNNKLPMKDWRGTMEGLGHTRVRTYIQSGNAVFESDRPASDIASDMTQAIGEVFGFRPSCVVLTLGQVEAALAACPFKSEGENAHKLVHVFFLNGPVKSYDPDGLQVLATQDEAFHMTDSVFYLYTPQGFGVSKVAEKLGKYLKGDMTARNLRTVETLIGMARE